MSILANLQEAQSLEELAKILGYTASGLAFIIFKIPPDKKYKKFEIAKRSGGTRLISAPTSHLKQVQKHLANVLYTCRGEIERTIARTPLSHGFRRGQSTLTNAKQHRNKRHVLNVDLENFFPSFNFGRVRGYFINNKNWRLHEKVATIIAQIACHENALPQGSPSSPVIADMIAEILDLRLVRLAKKYGCDYSRYADDITFSSNRLKFSNALAVVDPANFTVWYPGPRLEKAVSDAGLKLHPAKTRMKHCTVRQTVTGLVVNDKVNIKSEYYIYARAMCRTLFTTGAFLLPSSWVVAADEAELQKLRTEMATKPRLEGILNHIYYVRSSFDPRPEKTKLNAPTATGKLFKDFLFYRHFIGIDRPMLICEGKTDYVYVRSAMLALKKLVNTSVADGVATITTAISFFNYKSRRSELLKLKGGTGDVGQFLRKDKFEKDFKRINPLRPAHPVIVLLDNDQGAKDIFTQLKADYGVTINYSTTDKFYYLTRNLYVVKTDDSSGKQSVIEDYFDKTLLATKLSGKSFNPSDDFDNKTEFGKAVFAEKVVRANASKIDFKRFNVLLERIEAVIADYPTRI